MDNSNIIAKQKQKIALQNRKARIKDIKSNFNSLYSSSSFASKVIELDEKWYGFPIYAEPHVLVTDLYVEFHDWYFSRDLIGDLVEEAYSGYGFGNYYSSILCSNLAVEMALKFEYCKLHRDIADKLFSGEVSGRKYLSDFLSMETFAELGISNAVTIEEINILTDSRNGFTHFNTKKIRRFASKYLGKDVLNESSSSYRFLPSDSDLRYLALVVWKLSLKVLQALYPFEKVTENRQICLDDYKGK
jgi:hypothetical protein